MEVESSLLYKHPANGEQKLRTTATSPRLLMGARRR